MLEGQTCNQFSMCLTLRQIIFLVSIKASVCGNSLHNIKNIQYQEYTISSIHMPKPHKNNQLVFKLELSLIMMNIHHVIALSQEIRNKSISWLDNCKCTFRHLYRYILLGILKKWYSSRTTELGLTCQEHLIFIGIMCSKLELDDLITMEGVWDTTFHQQTNPLPDRLITPVHDTHPQSY